MKKTQQLQSNVINSIEDLKMRIQTVEDAGNALEFVKKLKDFSKEVEEKVKKRAWEIMEDDDRKEIDLEKFLILKIDPTETDNFKASSVFNGLGVERAISFMKVENGKLKKYLSNKDSASMEDIMKCQNNMTKRRRKGFIMIRAKKDEKANDNN